ALVLDTTNLLVGNLAQRQVAVAANSVLVGNAAAAAGTIDQCHAAIVAARAADCDGKGRVWLLGQPGQLLLTRQPAPIRKEVHRDRHPAFIAMGKLDPPAVEIAQSLDDGEPETRTLGAAGLPATKLTIEDARQLFFRNTRPGIENADLAGADQDSHLTVTGVTNGVANEVAQSHSDDRFRRDDTDALAFVDLQLEGAVTDQRLVVAKHLAGNLAKVVRAAFAIGVALGAHQMQQRRGDIGGLASGSCDSQQALARSLVLV